MATIVTATCSECFNEQEVELSARKSDIICRFCRHSVPMFEKHELDSIRSQLAGERRKMYIALAVFGGAAFLFVLYVMMSISDYQAEISSLDGKTSRYAFIERDEESITVLNPATDQEEKLRYATLLGAEIAQVKKDNPLMNDDEAAKRAGELYVKTMPPERSSMVQVLFYLSVLAGLTSIVFAAIASQDRLLCEF